MAPFNATHVVVGLVFNEKGQVLIAKRPPDKPHPGLWEFPGGKVEPNESVRDALNRELKEEVNLHILAAQPLMNIHHAYPDKAVYLNIWRVIHFEGTPQGLEGQLLRWVDLSELTKLSFPEANQRLIQMLASCEAVPQ